MKFSVANELLGIVAHTEDLLRDISQVDLAKDFGLTIFCWGDDNNCKDTIKYLKEKGLHAIIYDKVDVLIESKVCLLFSFAHGVSFTTNIRLKFTFFQRKELARLRIDSLGFLPFIFTLHFSFKNNDTLD